MKQSVVLQFITPVLNIIVPRFCYNCGCWVIQRTVLCKPCADRIRPVVSKELIITATHSMRVHAVSAYEYPLKALILAKAQANRVASIHLGQLIWQMNASVLDFDIIVPIPLHWTRYAYRGYNQAEEMARVFAAQSKKPVMRLIKRTKRTVFQSKIPLAHRADNVRDVFTLVSIKNKSQLYGKKILKRLASQALK